MLERDKAAGVFAIIDPSGTGRLRRGDGKRILDFVDSPLCTNLAGDDRASQ